MTFFVVFTAAILGIFVWLLKSDVVFDSNDLDPPDPSAAPDPEPLVLPAKPLRDAHGRFVKKTHDRDRA